MLRCRIDLHPGQIARPERAVIVKHDLSVDLDVGPSAEIAEGYGLFTLTTKSGEALAGRLGKETDNSVELILPTGETKSIPKDQIKDRAGPTSAMPPMALALPPKDLRDLVAYLSSLKTEHGASSSTFWCRR